MTAFFTTYSPWPPTMAGEANCLRPKLANLQAEPAKTWKEEQEMVLTLRCVL